MESDARNAVAECDTINVGDWIILLGMRDKEEQEPFARMFSPPSADNLFLTQIGFPLRVQCKDWPYVGLQNVRTKRASTAGSVPCDMRRWKWRLADEAFVRGVIGRPNMIQRVWAAIRNK